MGETLEQYHKRQAETHYHSTLCDVRQCNHIASHKMQIYDVPHGMVPFHVCSEHYDAWDGKTWEQFHPHVKAYNEFHG